MQLIVCYGISLLTELDMQEMLLMPACRPVARILEGGLHGCLICMNIWGHAWVPRKFLEKVDALRLFLRPFWDRSGAVHCKNNWVTLRWHAPLYF